MDAPEKAQANPTLLLADDSVTIQKVIELTFADQNVRVVAVGDGDQAIAFLEQSPPDIVLADVGMPGKSGYEVSRYIKKSPRLAHIPVLLLTGAFEPLDQSRAREAGCDGVLAKPFEPQAVINRVRELLGQPIGDPTAVEASAPPPTAASEPGGVSTSAENPAALKGATIGDFVEQPGAVHDAPTAGPSANTVRDDGALRASLAAQTDGVTADGKSDARSAPAVAAAQPPASPTTPTGKGTLAEAFAALLAAEARGAVPSDTASWLPQPPAATEDLIEQVAQRVLDRLSTQVVRDTVAHAVSGIAERLVVEEIERIKASIK